MPRIETPRVLIFQEDQPWMGYVLAGADSAEWEPVAFQDAEEALGAFDENIQALVTGLGEIAVAGQGHAAYGLIVRSTELEVPRAIVSGHPDADDYVREGTDIWIPKSDPGKIPGDVRNWLKGLRPRE